MGEAGDLGHARCGQILHRGVRSIGPQDRRRGRGVEPGQAEGLARRAERLPGEDQVIDQVDGRAGRQPLAREPPLANRRIVTVGDEIGLGNPSNKNRGHTKAEGEGAGQRPASLIAGSDGVTGRDGTGELIDDEGKVGRTPENALEVGEAAPADPPFPIANLVVAGCPRSKRAAGYSVMTFTIYPAGLIATNF